MRTEGTGVFKAVAEAMEIGRRARMPVDIIHLKIAEHKLWGKDARPGCLDSAARAHGQQVEANVYPYRAGQNNLASIIPPWAHEGGSRGDDSSGSRIRRCARAWRARSSTAFPAPTGTTTTRPLAAGKECCW